jgi:hypothetical protein
MSGRDRKFKAVALAEELREELSQHDKERIARRRLVATTGECPCGAVLHMPEPVPGSVVLVAVEHEPDCPAAEVQS